MHVRPNDPPSAGYILAGLCSFIFSGLGQLLLNRVWSAIGFFIIELILWGILLIFSGEEAGLIYTLITFFIVRVISAYFAANGHRMTFPSNGNE